MATNDFKPFATGAGANVMSQADYQALAALITGFQSGKASSAQVNKALRQATFVSAALAQFVSDKTGVDVLDDGDLSGFVTKLTNGFGKQYLSRSNPFSDIKADGAAAVSQALSNLGFGQSVEREGYLIWPGGLIMQWGTATGDQGNLGAAYPIAFKERVFQVLLTLNDKTAGAVDGVSLYATRDNFTNKTILVVQNKGKDLLGVTTASYFAIGK
ncbi:gp53-like domain-containing protein [Atlantibacter hermannii]|uniref:gp53-like domain-containing protein n=1 Tax=Atlantibacter hermannii TaxID=565 RepID=UPI002FDAD617